MRLTLARSGGFGGFAQTFSLEADELTPSERARFVALLSAADVWALPAELLSRTPAPDRFRYRLTVEDGARRHEVRVDEVAMSEPLRALVRWVEERSRPTPGTKRRRR